MEIMKRLLIFLLLLFIPYIIIAQSYEGVFYVPDSTTAFKKILPKGTIVVDRETTNMWMITTTTTSTTKTLQTTTTKEAVGGSAALLDMFPVKYTDGISPFASSQDISAGDTVYVDTSKIWRQNETLALYDEGNVNVTNKLFVGGDIEVGGGITIGSTDSIEQGTIINSNLTKQFQYYDGVEWLTNDEYYDDSLFVLRDSVDAIGTGFEFAFFRFRFNDTTDYVFQTWEDNDIDLTYSYNNNFQFYKTQTILHSTAYTAHAMNYATTISKTLDSDAINPINFKNLDTWLGGKHGFEFPVLTVASHDKDNTDIGAIYEDDSSQYKLMTVISPTQLRFLQQRKSKTGLLWFADKSPDATLTYVSGGTPAHNGSVSVASQSYPQYHPCTKNVDIKYYINGTTLMENYTSTWCKFVDVVEYYEIIDPTTINVTYPIDVTTGNAWVKVWNTYRFYNGGVVQYHKLEFVTSADVEHVGYMQPAKASLGVDSLGWLYIPKMDTIHYQSRVYDFGNMDTLYQESVIKYFRIQDLESGYSDSPPDRIVWVSDDLLSVHDFAEACGINPDYPGMSNLDRANNNDTIWLLSGSYGGKISPVLVDNERITADSILTAITYKTIFDPKQITSNADLFYYNRQGNYYYVYADYVDGNTITTDTLELPYYMNGRNIAVVESDSITVVSGSNVKEGTIVIEGTFIENGHIVIRLSGNYVPKNSTVLFETPKKRVLLDYAEFTPQTTTPTPSNSNNAVVYVDTLANLLKYQYGLIDTIQKNRWLSEHYAMIYGAFTVKPHDTIAIAQDWMVKRIEDIGAWDLLDGFNVNAVGNATDALINWVYPFSGSAISYDSPTFTAWEGFTFSAANSRIDQGETLTTETNYSQDDASFGVYCRTNTNNNYYTASAKGTATHFLILDTRAVSDYAKFRVNYNTTIDSVANADGRGMFIINRLNSTQQSIMITSPLYTKAETTHNKTSTGVPNSTIKTGLYDTSCQDQISLTFWGGGLSTAMREEITDAFEAYMDFLGKGVIP